MLFGQKIFQYNSLQHFNTCSVCELSYRYFIKYENMQSEWKQMLKDSGIHLQDLVWENASGLKGKWSKISWMTDFNIKYVFSIFSLYFLFHFWHFNLYVRRITINITKILQMTKLSNYMKSFGQISLRLATHWMVS